MWFNRDMFDQVLDKKGFVARLKELGYNEERVEEEWKKIEEGFYKLCFVNAYLELSEVDKEAITRMGGFKADDPKSMLEAVYEFLKKNEGKVDMMGIIGKSANQVYELYLAGLAKGRA